MRILNLEQIEKGLKDKKLYAVAAATGLSYPTVRKLAEGRMLDDGTENNPTNSTLERISTYIIDSLNAVKNSDSK